jgi:hypothetical protein
MADARAAAEAAEAARASAEAAHDKVNA